MKASCCAAGLQQCVSVAYDTAAGGGCSKRNDDGGWLNSSGFVDYAIKTGHEQPVTGAPHLEQSTAQKGCCTLADVIQIDKSVGVLGPPAHICSNFSVIGCARHYVSSEFSLCA